MTAVQLISATLLQHGGKLIEIAGRVILDPTNPDLLREGREACISACSAIAQFETAVEERER